MKKIVALLLTILYFTTTSGVVLNVHYCMGKISSVKIDNFKNTFCKCGKSTTSSGCCRTELKVVKLGVDHKAITANFSCKVPVTDLSTPVSLIDLAETPAPSSTLFVANAPPPPSSKIYKENCVFRI